MAENFYTILTKIGRSKISNSAVSGSKVNFKTLKLGDGNGAYYEPSENQTSLIKEVWSGNINSISVDDANTNWIIVETVIPATDGGFFIREAGIFDEAGDMIAVGKLSETYKPVVSEGSTKDLVIKIILEVSNTNGVALKIDPNVVIATKNDIQVLESKFEDIDNKLSFVEQEIEDLGNQIEVKTRNDILAREEIMDIKLKLEEQTSINFINKTGIGFFDTFVDNSNIDLANSTAAYDSTNKSVKFTGSQNLKLVTENFDNFKEMDFCVYPAKINKATVDTSSTNSKTVAIKSSDKVLSVGDKLFMNNLLNEVVGVTDNSITADMTVQTPVQRTVTLNTNNGIAGSVSSLGINNTDQFVKDSKGNLYLVYADTSAPNQIICKKSSDNGVTWTDISFPTISGYAQAEPSIAVDSLDNVHVIWQGLDSSNTSYYQIKYSKFNGTSWSAWINIQTITGYNQGQPSLVIDGNNNLHVAWNGWDSVYATVSQIKYSKFNGTSWSTWSNVQVIGSYAQGFPSIAIDSKNNVHMVWYGMDSSNTSQQQIKYSKFNGTSWSTWVNISVVSGYGQLFPSIAIDSLDNLHVVWQGTDSSNTTKSQIKYSKFNGTSWSTWLNICVISGYAQSTPLVFIDINNNPLVAWSGVVPAYPSYTSISYSKFNGTSWSALDYLYSGSSFNYDQIAFCRSIKTIGIYTPVRIIRYGSQISIFGIWTNTSTYNSYTAIASVAGYTNYNNGDKIVRDSKGNLYAVYYTDQIYCRKSSDNGATWTDMSFPVVSGYAQYSPSIAIDSKDNLHVVWFGCDSLVSTANNQIKYSKFNGTSWSTWANIQLISGYTQSSPSIAIDSKDNIHVVWNGYDASNTTPHQIKYSKFNGTSWSAWINICVITGYSQQQASIAIDSKDNLHVVWHGCDGGSTNYTQVHYCKYTNGGSWSLFGTISSTGSTCSHGNADIAIDSKDNLYVVWSGTDSGNTNPQIKYAKYINGGSWSLFGLNIQTVTSYNQYFPSIAIDSNDNLHVVWFGADSTHGVAQIKYSKFDGASWSAWVNYTNITVPSNGAQQYPSICRNFRNFLEPLVIWQDNYGNTVQFRGKFTIKSGSTLLMNTAATLSSNQQIPIIDFDVKQAGVSLALNNVDSEKFIFSASNLNTGTADINVIGKDNSMNSLVYAIS